MACKQTLNGKAPTDARACAIVACIRRGDPYADIALRFAISIPRVAQLAKVSGLGRHNGYMPVDDDELRMDQMSKGVEILRKLG